MLIGEAHKIPCDVYRKKKRGCHYEEVQALICIMTSSSNLPTHMNKTHIKIPQYSFSDRIYTTLVISSADINENWIEDILQLCRFTLVEDSGLRILLGFGLWHVRFIASFATVNESLWAETHSIAAWWMDWLRSRTGIKREHLFWNTEPSPDFSPSPSLLLSTLSEDNLLWDLKWAKAFFS